MIRLILVIAAVLFFGFAFRRVFAGGSAADMRAVSQTDDGVRDLLRMQKKVAAIKLYRQLHGVGLKEAKDAVDRMAADL